MNLQCKKVYSAKEMRNFQDALYVLSGKWKLPIIKAIASGNNRFKQISEILPNISPRALSKELKILEENQIITKQYHDEDFPSWHEYQFTEHSKTLEAVINALMSWADTHREVLFKERSE